MNKRLKKKQRLTHLLHVLVARVGLLERTNSLQQELLEDYGNKIGDLERRVAELERVGGANVLACNNRFDQLEADNKALRIDLDKTIFEFKKPRRSFF